MLALTCSLLFAASGSAAPITVGSPLSASFTKNATTPESYAAAATALGEPGAHAASPVSGAIIRWRLIDGKGTGFELWVLRPTGGGSYRWIDHSSPAAAAGGALEAFSANVPISAGDLVALYVPPEGTDAISYLGAPGSQTIVLGSVPAKGGEVAPVETYANTEYGFNAEVLPPPTIAAISPAEGPTAGGTSVTIAGTNFIEVTSVQFGENPARSFAVTNEGVLTAIAPSGTPGRVPVKVTTVAGSATSPQPFIYSSVPNLPLESNLLPPLGLNTCKVPNLIGKNLKATKKRLREADCTLGQVVKNTGVTAKNGKIVKQKPKPATVRPAGSKVSVKLG
jgi:hypothetical protein